MIYAYTFLLFSAVIGVFLGLIPAALAYYRGKLGLGATSLIIITLASALFGPLFGGLLPTVLFVGIILATSKKPRNSEAIS